MTYGEATNAIGRTNNVDLSKATYHGRKDSVWSYRCFTMQGYKKGWKVKNRLPAFDADVPKQFVWAGSKEDRLGLCSYVDAILLGQRAKASEYEGRGFITDIEMPHIDKEDIPRINVNIKRLVDFLLLRDHFNVPLWGKIAFITDGTQIVPKNFIAALIQLDSEIAKALDPKKAWRTAYPRDIINMGLQLEDVTSGMYRSKDQAQEQVAQVSTEPFMVAALPNTPPQEVRVSLKKHDEYFDLLTQVRPDGERPYYTRRIARNNGALLWCGTAYDSNGPWTVWTREAAELMALGIDL